MQTIHCKLCQQHRWAVVTEVEFGLWAEQANGLERDSQTYSIGECLNCHHVQMMHNYDATIFSKLYFHTQQEAVMWHESLLESLLPYEEMIDFFKPYLSEKAVIADFGCGTGSLLNAIQKSGLSTRALIGIDFNNRCDSSVISYLCADLNDLSKISTNLWPQGIDLATASHVLEHLIDPVNFLNEVGKHLTKDGLLFIEVPDFSQPLSYDLSGLSNLVNLQHIHYFTVDSLTAMAAACGYKVLSIKQLLTGYIPRLQVMLQKTAITQKLSKTIKKAVEAVQQNVQSGILKRQQFAELLMQQTSKNKKVGLWGIGADFYLLIKENPDILKLCQQGNCELFDFQLASKFCFGVPIRSSKEIPQVSFPVFMTPLLAETRIKMHRTSTSWPSVLDPFLLKKGDEQRV